MRPSDGGKGELGDFNEFSAGQRALALSKDTWVIGSPTDPNEAGGIDPERDENLSQSGAVYILR